MSTLCVIDVQPAFKPAEIILPAVVKEIEKAKNNNNGIVVLEYKSFMRSYEIVRNVLGKYKNKAFGFKSTDDGSIHFLEACKSRGFVLDVVKIIGVNTGYCVRATVLGLLWSERVKQVEVVLNAVNGYNPEWELKELKESVESFKSKIKFI